MVILFVVAAVLAVVGGGLFWMHRHGNAGAFAKLIAKVTGSFAIAVALDYVTEIAVSAALGMSFVALPTALLALCIGVVCQIIAIRYCAVRLVGLISLGVDTWNSSKEKRALVRRRYVVAWRPGFAADLKWHHDPSGGIN